MRHSTQDTAKTSIMIRETSILHTAGGSSPFSEPTRADRRAQPPYSSRVCGTSATVLTMPPYSWTNDRDAVIKAIEARGLAEARDLAESGALVAWATDSVEALHYLCDVDAEAFGADRTHAPHIIDAAHVAWSCGTAITALDRCAAALGRVFANGPTIRSNGTVHELDVRSLKLPNVGVPSDVITWLAGVRCDPDYGVVHGARNPMTHARLVRNFTMSRQRIQFTVGTGKFEAEDLVQRAARLATSHVEAFLAKIPF
jgi:hypothetical protein